MEAASWPHPPMLLWMASCTASTTLLSSLRRRAATTTSTRSPPWRGTRQYHSLSWRSKRESPIKSRGSRRSQDTRTSPSQSRNSSHWLWNDEVIAMAKFGAFFLAHQDYPFEIELNLVFMFSYQIWDLSTNLLWPSLFAFCCSWNAWWPRQMCKPRFARMVDNLYDHESTRFRPEKKKWESTRCKQPTYTAVKICELMLLILQKNLRGFRVDLILNKSLKWPKVLLAPSIMDLVIHPSKKRRFQIRPQVLSFFL